MPIERLDPIIAAVFRHTGPHEAGATDTAWERVILWASPRRLLGRDPEVRGVGLLWDDPRFVNSSMRRYDVGIPVSPRDAGEIGEPAAVLVTMPGEYLRVTHKGPYEKIFGVYSEAIGIQLQMAQVELAAAPIIELYRNSPSDVPAEELLTDIYLPVVQV